MIAREPEERETPEEREPLDPADAPGFDPGSYYDERDERAREADAQDAEERGE